MWSVEERLSSLEARVDAHAAGLSDLRQAVVHLEQRMDRRFEAIDRRFEGLDGRLAGMDSRLSSLDDKFSRYFVWMLGAQVSTLAAIVAVLARG